MLSQDEVPALFKRLASARHDTTRCNLLIQIAENLYYSKPDTVKPICEEVIRIVETRIGSADEKERRAYLIAKGSALTDIGIVEGRAGNYDKEIYFNLESIKIQKEINNKVGLASAYNNLGIVYTNIGDISKAIDYCFNALKLQEEIGDKEGQALSLNNIGYNFKLVGEFQKALEYYNKSLIIHQQIKSLHGEAMTLNNIANIYEKNGLVPCSKNRLECIRSGRMAALEIYKKCYALQQKADDKIGMAYTLNNIAISYKNLGDTQTTSGDNLKAGRKTALEYFMKSLEFHRQLNNKRGIAYVADNISNLYLLENNLNEAEKFGRMSFDLSKEQGEPEIMQRSAATLKNIYRSQKKYQEAFQMFTIESQMKDSINNEQGRKLLFQKSIQYNYEKKALADSLRSAEEIRTADLKFQKELAAKKSLLITVVAIIVIVLILAVLIFILMKNIRQRREAFAVLQEKNVEIREQSERLIELSRQVTRYQTQMNPHFVFNALNSIQGFVINNEKEKTLKQLQNFAKLMRQTLNNSVNDKIDLATELQFLKLYVEFESERFSKNVALKISLQLTDEEIMVPPMLLQPLIENSLKHAGLGEVDNPAIELSFSEEGNLLRIEIKDNGKGITQNFAEMFSDSHALGILKSRLQLIFEQENMKAPLNNIAIHSNDEYISCGTAISFKIPLITKF